MTWHLFATIRTIEGAYAAVVGSYDIEEEAKIVKDQETIAQSDEGVTYWLRECPYIATCARVCSYETLLERVMK